MLRLAAVACLILAPPTTPLAAQHDPAALLLGIGGTRSDDFSGFTMTGAFVGERAWYWGGVVADLSVGPAGDDSRYQRDDFNGGSVCRDTDTGRFADSSRCTSLNAGIAAEAGGAVGNREARVYGGIGYRLSNAIGPYVALRIRLRSEELRYPFGFGVAIGSGLVRGEVAVAFPVEP